MTEKKYRINDYNTGASSVDLEKVESFREMRAYITSFWQKKERPTLLDIGCGIGYTTSFLSSVAEVIGIDINEVGINQAKQLYPQIEFRLHDITLQQENEFGKKFDFILLNNVVEHLQDPQRETLFIKLKTNLLNPDGKIIFGYANAYHPVQILWSILIGKGLFDPTHVHNWTIREWKQVIEQNFSILDQKLTSPYTKFISLGRHFKVDHLCLAIP